MQTELQDESTQQPLHIKLLSLNLPYTELLKSPLDVNSAVHYKRLSPAVTQMEALLCNILSKTKIELTSNIVIW